MLLSAALLSVRASTLLALPWYRASTCDSSALSKDNSLLHDDIACLYAASPSTASKVDIRLTANALTPYRV